VIYDSRHGFTQRCLDHLTPEVSAEVELWPVRTRQGTPEWQAYKAVVFGGPVYYGKWSAPLVRFVTRHTAALTTHPVLAAFVVSLSPKAAALKYFSAGLPPALKGRLGHVACFGGGFVWKNLSWWERLLVKRAQGIETDASNFDLPAIHGLAAWLSANSPRP